MGRNSPFLQTAWQTGISALSVSTRPKKSFSVQLEQNRKMEHLHMWLWHATWDSFMNLGLFPSNPWTGYVKEKPWKRSSDWERQSFMLLVALNIIRPNWKGIMQRLSVKMMWGTRPAKVTEGRVRKDWKKSLLPMRRRRKQQRSDSQECFNLPFGRKGAEMCHTTTRRKASCQA